jgi:hypothetical protein
VSYLNCVHHCQRYVNGARDIFDLYEVAAIKTSSIREYEDVMKQKEEDSREGEVQLGGLMNFLADHSGRAV